MGPLPFVPPSLISVHGACHPLRRSHLQRGRPVLLLRHTGVRFLGINTLFQQDPARNPTVQVNDRSQLLFETGEVREM